MNHRSLRRCIRKVRQWAKRRIVRERHVAVVRGRQAQRREAVA